jgi:hypothetical protein
MRRIATIAAVLVVGVAVLWAADAAGPDVEGLINKGLKAYKDGKTEEAIASLQAAIAAMQKSQEKGMATIFPAAPDGWEAGKIDSGSMSGASGGESTVSWTNISRRYTNKAKEDLTVTIALTNSDKMVEAQKGIVEAYKNPQVLAAMNASGKIAIKPIDKSGWAGFSVVNKESGGDATLMVFKAGYCLHIAVNKGDADTLELFWKAVNLDAVAKDSKTEK